MRTTTFFLFLVFFAWVFLTGCGEASTSSNEEAITNEIMPKRDAIKHSERLNELTKKIIAAIPEASVVEGVLDRAQATYNMELLNPLENAGKYQLSSKKAGNLGVYLCDLGYISSFHQTQELILYIKTTKRLAESLGVQEVVDEETMENLELNLDNQDSLLSIIRGIYDDTYAFLKERNRLSTTALLVSGGWVEGLHLAMQLLNPESPDDKMVIELEKQYQTYLVVMQLLNSFEETETAALRQQLEVLNPTMEQIAQGTITQEQLLLLRAGIYRIRTALIAP
jgi:hypothetical protein